ncbi:MAG TPA: ISKra4 family transposase [Roseiflexaceae bacterium]|nr:ISKra4 family transposase [Roseiflexaceae bacterium]
MPSNAELIVAQIQHDMFSLITYVSGPESASQTAYTVELTLFRRLLALGAALLQLFFLTRAARRPAPPSAPDGSVFTYHDQRPTTYLSVFGKLRFERHYFVAAAQPGCCPLDAELSLPKRCYSDLLREWTTYGASDGAYRETASTIERILGLEMSVAALESSVREDAQDVPSFYAQPRSASDTADIGTILVVQADGKGVPMVQTEAAEQPLRLSKGQKRTKKKEAVVTSLYTIARYIRTPQDVRAALLHQERRADHPSRPAPVHKETRATLDGKAVALQRLEQRATQRDGRHICSRVALSDGAESLQQQLLSAFPDYTLILDIIHASEYLWDAATALLGESNPMRTAWVELRLEMLLAGQSGALLAQLREQAAADNWTETQRKAIERTIGYYERNQAYMRYDEYLAQGWPIGTGVVEGACGHLVKDRMEQAGMRWTKDGAQAVLELRAVRINGDWDRYWQFHRLQQHQRLYGTASATTSPEVQVLQMAA